MTTQPLQSNLQLVDKDGRMTQVTEETLQEWVRELQALRTIATDHETRITTLEP
ncbi:MAG: hypothetical protein ACPGSI_18840 [Pikeienuella sp.]